MAKEKATTPGHPCHVSSSGPGCACAAQILQLGRWPSIEGSAQIAYPWGIHTPFKGLAPLGFNSDFSICWLHDLGPSL